VKILNNHLFLFSITCLLFTLVVNESFAQKKGEFSILAGYQMLGSVQVYNYNYGYQNVDGDLDINDAVYYSAALGINTSRETMAEIQYIFQPTSVKFVPYNFGSSTSFDADVHYILATGYFIKQFSRTGSGYGGISIGAAGLVPKNTLNNLDPAWRFAFGFTLGLKFLLSKNIGLKIQSQALFPIQWAGGTLYGGSGGAGYGISAGTSIIQINVGGGLYYAF
jgi:hypothetical protein